TRIRKIPEAHDAALAGVRSWLESSDSELRAEAGKLLAKESEEPVAAWRVNQLSNDELSSAAKALVTYDALTGARSHSAVEEVSEAAICHESREVRAMTIAAYKTRIQDRSTQRDLAVSQLTRLLGDTDLAVAEAAGAAFVELAQHGLQDVVEFLLAEQRDGKLSHETGLATLTALAETDSLSGPLVLQLRRAIEDVDSAITGRASAKPRQVRFRQRSAQPNQPHRSQAERVLSAAAAFTEDSTELTPARADLIRLALNHERRLDQWLRVGASEEQKRKCELLDLPAAFLMNAFAQLEGRDVVPYFRDAPELARAMADAVHLSAAEAHYLVEGEFPAELVELSTTEAAREGLWRDIDLANHGMDTGQFADALRLQILLGDDRIEALGAILEHVLNEGAAGNKAVVLDALHEVTGIDLSFFDASLSEKDRLERLEQLRRPDGAVGELLDRAVIERLEVSPPNSVEGRILVAYLSGGDPTHSSRVLTRAVE
ncbi:MAG: hypothetical protein AAFQ82_23635, partial [Myxococcota bacterium]